MLRSFFILSFLFLIEIQAIHRRCINEGILLPQKILRSPIIVYGEPVSKTIYLDTNTQQLFNVTFTVHCVFKGQDVEREILITEAGIKAGHTSCQWLDPGQLYIVFLEKWGTNVNGYRPVDFQEIPVNNITYDLLEKTCHLKPSVPLHSTGNDCPKVSIVHFCPHDEIDVSVLPKRKSSENFINTNVRSSYFETGNQFYLQSNVTIPKDGSQSMQLGDRSRNTASLLSRPFFLFISILIMVLGDFVEH